MIRKWILGNQQNNKRATVIWNAIGGAISAGQVAILLIFVSHKLGIITSGMVTIGYAVAGVFLALGKYGVRNYQVTDNNEQFSFGDYFYCRLIAVALVLGILCIYLAYCHHYMDYPCSKLIIVFELTILKMVDAFEDVVIGRYQQVGRLDVGAKIMALRLILSTAFMCILVCCNANIYFVLLGGFILSVLMDTYLLQATFGIADARIGKIQKEPVFKLLRICLPLCIGTTLSIYVGNIPKYMIDAYMDEEVQAIFGYIMMPVFVIMLLNNFIYQPIVKDLGNLWEHGDRKAFTKSIWRQSMAVIGLTVIMMAAGLTLGLPVLSILYNADLTRYRMEFAILLLGGGFYALAYYLNVPLTTIRKHNYIAIGYTIAAVLSVLFGKYMVIAKGMSGAAILYLGINMLLVVIYLCVLVRGITGGKGIEK